MYGRGMLRCEGEDGERPYASRRRSRSPSSESALMGRRSTPHATGKRGGRVAGTCAIVVSLYSVEVDPAPNNIRSAAPARWTSGPPA